MGNEWCSTTFCARCAGAIDRSGLVRCGKRKVAESHLRTGHAIHESFHGARLRDHDRNESWRSDDLEGNLGQPHPAEVDGRETHTVGKYVHGSWIRIE